jgi:hypothetical protein
MESVARLSSAERRELFAETAARKGITPAIVEKDFWVCWTLGRLFAHPDLSRLLMFKGGTSLSKVFNLIERFSEDIDLILDWRVVVGEDDPLAERSNNKQEALNKTIEAKAVDYIGGEMLAMISQAVDPICRCEVAVDDLHALNVRRPSLMHICVRKCALRSGRLPGGCRLIIIESNHTRLRRSRSFSSKRIVQCKPYVPSVPFGRRRRFFTTKPIARKVVRSRYAIRVTITT